MTIDDLISELQDLKARHGNLELWQQEDAEGNGYERLRGVDVGFMAKDFFEDDYVFFDLDEAIEAGNEVEDVKFIAVVFP